MSDPATLDATDPVALARALIRCESVTPAEGGALALTERVLARHGFLCQRLTFSDRDTPDVDNLFARLGGRGPTLCFAGHTDVVPPGDTARWQHGPFEAAVADGRLFGRGAVDMKGAVACFLAATARYLERHGAPRGSIALLLTGDEEGPSINGTRKVLGWMAETGERVDHCIVGEPTNVASLGDTIKVGRRGSLSGTIEIRGKQGHVAYPEKAANPCRAMVDVLHGLLRAPLDDGSARFQPSNLEVTSIDVGNPATNVIPAVARASFNVRFNDHHTPRSLMARLRRALEQATEGSSCTARVAFEANPAEAFVTTAEELVELMRDAVEAETGRQPDLTTGGGTSDARYIKDHCPVIEFGLVGDTMHQVDESVPVEDLEGLTRVYLAFLERYFDRMKDA